MKKKYIAFVAGKSGGHLLPCITTAQKIVDNDSSYSILFFTTKSKLDNDLIQSYPLINKHIQLPLSSLNNWHILKIISFINTLLFSFFMSFTALLKTKPKKIISMGGAVSIPVCLAAWILRIPFELIELNVVPGKTTRMLAPFATTLTICLPQTAAYFKKQCTLADYPIRFNAAHRYNAQEARSHLSLDPQKKTIFIVGGSQGSLFLNTMAKSLVENHYNAQDIQIIHQTGMADSFDWQAWYALHKISAFTFSFYKEIEYCYSAADLIICRSGAGTLFEVIFFNKPCITIPLITATTGHQKDNAYAFAHKYSQIRVIEQQALIQNQALLVKALQNLFNISI